MTIDEIAAIRDATAEIVANMREAVRLQELLKISPADAASTIADVAFAGSDCFLSASKAGELLGVGSHRINAYERKGILHSYKLADVEHKKYYRKSEVLALPQLNKVVDFDHFKEGVKK